jgi:uncharacterized protein involved in outer membrane biogenesis
MKFLCRWAFRGLILLLVAAIALVLLKDVLLKAWAEQQVRSRTGMDMKIGRFETGLFTPTLTIEDLVLYNTPEYGGSPFLRAPDLHIEVDTRALTSRHLHLKLVRLALTELNIVEGFNGRTNLVLDPSRPAPSLGVLNSNSVLGLQFTGIDTLNLSLGKLTYRSLKRPHQDTELRLNLHNEIITNIRTADQLAETLTRTIFRNGFTVEPARRR